MKPESRLSTWLHRTLHIPYLLNIKVFQAPKRPLATFVFIHGIGNSLEAWDEVIKGLPKNVRIIGIDLLGFGDSPKPHWATYDAKNQARSVAMTLMSLRLTQRPILVGHSLGALVAVEIAQGYALVIHSLVLCSPPFYKPEAPRGLLLSQDDALRRLYRLALKHPEELQKAAPLAVKWGLANKAFRITAETTTAYMSALEASIINQTTLTTLKNLSLPITIFYGTFDPVVVSKNITELPKALPNIIVKRVVAGHEVQGSYARAVSKKLAEFVRNLDT